MKVEINGKTYCVETLIADNERLRKDVIASADTIRLVLDKIRAELHATAEYHIDGDYYLRDEWIDEIFDKYKADKERGMITYIIGEADRIHVKGEYYKGEKLLRCSNCGTRGISMFDRHCNGCGFLLDRIDSVDGAMRFSHTPPIKEVEELPDFTKRMEVTYVRERSE